jgi:phosphoenolpyruvate carboxylase
MQVLLAEPLYREHVRSRGNAQVVMLGYSDSNKESGLAASRWALHEAQIAIVDTLERAPGGAVEPTLFHGRGGTISRGGGKARNGILAEPPGVVRGKLRVTEQGEIIAQKYGLEDIALRTIEMTTGALLERTAPQPPGDAEVAEWHEAARIVATRSRDAYRALVYGTPAFIDYFRAATPIDVIERMRIGSRPPARRSMAGVENLRAIPWVFAWTQSRLNLPGWYGVGTGLEALIDAIGIESVRETAQAWRFLGNLVADTEMVLAKTDIAIAAHYAELAGSAGEPMFRHLKAEFERTLQLVCTVNDAEALLDRDPVLQRNIRLRNPYVDPMSLVQVDFLQRWRDSGRADEGLLEVLMSTVRGISRGMQNTG